MTHFEYLSLLIPVIGSLIAIILSYFIARREVAARIRQSDSDAMEKRARTSNEQLDAQDKIEKMTSRLIDAYDEKLRDFEKKSTDLLRTELDNERSMSEAEASSLRTKVDAETGGLRDQVKLLEEQVKRATAEADSSRTTAESLKREVETIQQSRRYANFRDALNDLAEKIEDYCTDCAKRGIQDVTIDLQLIAVSMTFSWEYFVITRIPEILDKHKKAKATIRVAFIDPAFLEEAGIGKGRVDWVSKGKQRLDDVRSFIPECAKYDGRLHFMATTYCNLPHWHGWLFNGEHLFLGRTDWVFDNEGNAPELRVGQNEYRHFDANSTEGARRIDLFARWQKYYFEKSPSSKLVAASQPVGDRS